MIPQSVVRWSEAKNRELQQRRGISFDRIAALYEREEFEAIVKHETRPNQQMLVMKTAYPSRKLHQLYGGDE